jgi:hypothetical protein
MKSVFAIFGILVALGGMFCGVLNWYLTEFYLDSVEWEGPMLMVNRGAWILNTLGLGLGTILIGIAAMMRSPA